MSKKSFYLVIALILMCFKINAQIIPNGSFESWTSMGAYSDPTGWATTNLFSTAPYPVEMDSPGAVGTSFIKLTNRINQGVAATGATLGGLTPSFAVTGQPLCMEGQYQANITGADTAVIEIIFTKCVSGVTNLVGVGSLYISAGAQTTWTGFSVPVSYFGVPDSAMVYLASGSNANPANTVVGNYLYVDALTLCGTTGTEEISITGSDVNIYPNPASTELHINASVEYTNIKIVNSIGQAMYSYPKQDVISVASLSSGIYFMQLLNDNRGLVKTLKFVKE